MREIFLPTLGYHGIYPDSHPVYIGSDPVERKYMVTPEEFAVQMALLRTEGYTPLTFQQLQQFQRNGQFPERPVLITFDDGRSSDLHALETLLRYNLAGMFFVTTDNIGVPYFLSPEAVAQIANTFGMYIGSHGQQHISLTDISEELVHQALEASREAIAGWTGIQPKALSWPYGSNNDNTIAIATANGFTHLFTTQLTPNTSETPPTRLGRVLIHRGTNLETFLLILRMDEAFVKERNGEKSMRKFWAQNRGLASVSTGAQIMIPEVGTFKDDELKAVLALETAREVMRRDLASLIDHYLPYDRSFIPTLSYADRKQQALQQMEFVLEELFYALAAEVKSPYLPHPDNGWVMSSKIEDRKSLISLGRKNEYREQDRKVEYYVWQNFEVISPQQASRQSQTGNDEVQPPLYLWKQFRDDKKSVIRRGNFERAVSANTPIVYCNLAVRNAQKRISRVLENIYADTQRMSPEKVVIFNININWTDDDTLGEVYKFLDAHPDVFMNITEVSSDQLAELHGLACYSIGCNINHRTAFELDRQLKGEDQLSEPPAQVRSSMFVCADDIQFPQRKDGRSNIEMLIERLHSHPDAYKVIAASCVPSPDITPHSHPLFYYLSNIEKSLLDKALPKPLAYGACYVSDVETHKPIYIPAFTFPIDDIFLQFLHVGNLLRYLRPDQITFDNYPVQTHPDVVFYHPEDPTLQEYLQEKRYTLDILHRYATTAVGEEAARVVNQIQLGLLAQHKDSLYRALVEKFGITSREFIGQLLLGRYLVRSAVNENYTA